MEKTFKNLTPELTKQFSIDEQFDLYLKLVKLDKRKMAPNQIKEMRRCFFGAFGQLLLLIQEADVQTPLHMMDIYSYLTKQVSDAFTVETLPEN